MQMMTPLSESELQSLYAWVDDIPLSRSKRNISRDFSDAVLLAEVIKYHFPRMIELHNYSAANSYQQKLYNWSTLHQRVLRKLDIHLHKEEIEGLASGDGGKIERLLRWVQLRCEQRKADNIMRQQERMMPTMQSHEKLPPVYHSPHRDWEVQYLPPSTKIPQPSMLKLPEPRTSQLNRTSNVKQLPVLPMSAPPALEGSSLQSLLDRKDQTITELNDHVANLEMRLGKMEQILKIKELKIQKLTAKLTKFGMTAP
ncbi:hypothetical protein PROFUN_11802 [Planoprotostelium fungivorum]|uniref:Calponin-homology (CH) domain-containing protein n=1 Tax=Planoprotostelium fungivorum TaxID=1890364 RepID=A0A2P6MRG9_9EUKA|nr:hypothetical protein PROFUN_11802 [Planoprotostelium fungivorum]